MEAHLTKIGVDSKQRYKISTEIFGDSNSAEGLESMMKSANETVFELRKSAFFARHEEFCDDPYFENFFQRVNSNVMKGRVSNLNQHNCLTKCLNWLK